MNRIDFDQITKFHYKKFDANLVRFHKVFDLCKVSLDEIARGNQKLYLYGTYSIGEVIDNWVDYSGKVSFIESFHVVVPKDGFEAVEVKIKQLSLADEASIINFLCLNINIVKWFVVITDPESYSSDGIWNALYVSCDQRSSEFVGEIIGSRKESIYPMGL